MGYFAFAEEMVDDRRIIVLSASPFISDNIEDALQNVKLPQRIILFFALEASAVPLV